MKLKGINDEDFINYKLPSMFLITSYCDFKCDRESGENCCQNSSLAKLPVKEINDNTIIQRYLSNPITKGIVFGGLEPFEQFDEVLSFISLLRGKYACNDDIVIYTGYNKAEVENKTALLLSFGNIIIKYGRFIPNQPQHYDEVLGVNLKSNNQYAERIC